MSGSRTPGTGTDGSARAGRMSDAAVQARTGKVWDDWFAILDAAGADRRGHQEIAGYLHDEHRMDDWWCQMVTVTYEQARGLREKHQKADGYSVSGSRTVALPVEKLFEAWQDEALRERWMPEADIVVRKATAPKSMRVTWTDGKTSLEINFYAKGENKSQVALQHNKLPDGDTAALMKAYWATALDRMRDVLEG